MKCKCKIKKIEIDNHDNISLEIVLEKNKEALEELECKKDKELLIKLEQYREKRSLNANAYMWQLCAKIAEKIGGNLTKEDVYRQNIRDGNVFETILVKCEAVKSFINLWESRGIGWIAVIAGMNWGIGKYSTIFAYKGSSEYNSKEMSSLIDRVVLEAKELGIETMTSNEIEDMISLIDQSK